MKRLELVGFKSFGERSEMILHPGTTAIVGPNGSGKSNIGEAIMWSLGEHNSHNLRCLSAGELVYNGNGLRRPQNYAEVSLVIDNEEGWLPVAFREVQITRRVDRSGEGECFINKARCRLRDVQELFLATGLGHRGYWVVSQNQIDSVLSVKAEARRELIEEAAGTSRYRFRRQEVVRKLEATERNLARVKDIVAEVEAQLEPLAEEAENARRYKDASSRLRDLELSLLLDENRTALAQMQHLRQRQEALSESLALARKERQHAAEERQTLESEERELGSAVDSLREQVAEVASRRQRLQAEMMLAQNELRQALRDQEEAKDESKEALTDLEEVRARQRQIEVDLRDDTERLQSLRQAGEEKAEQLALANEERQKADEERRSLEGEEMRLERQLDELRRIVTQASRQRQGLQVEVVMAEDEMRQASRQQQDAKTDIEQLRTSLQEAVTGEQDIETALEAEARCLQELGEARQKKTEQLQETKDALRAETWERIEEGLESAHAQASDLQRQVEGLFSLIQNQERESATRVARDVAAHLSSLVQRLSLLAGSRQRREEGEALRERLASEQAELGAEVRVLEERIEAGKADFDAAKRRISSLRTEMGRRIDAEGSIQESAELAQRKVSERTTALQNAEKQLSALEADLAELSRHRSEVRERLLSLGGSRQGDEGPESLRERLLAEVSEISAEKRAAEERINSRRTALQGVQQQILSMEKAGEERHVAATALLQAVGQAEQRVKEQAKSLEQAENDWGGLQRELAELSQKRSSTSQRGFAVREAESSAANQEEELSNQLHQAELRRARLESRLEAVQERLAEYRKEDMTDDSPPDQPLDRARAEVEVARLRQELSRLGEVNLGAIYHYERLAERKAFLQEQSLDLEQGKESLQKAIQEIDQRTRSQFLSTFRKVGEEFQTLFRRLFGGGETQLTLTDATNLLETGVEIAIRLPGKEMMNLLSLSGGERSLTAIAFLFSLLLVRPSPFCVLDEVDAALDEANTRKFASLLQEMNGRTQFLVITHNPLTMESASYLYGVTVGDSGASKLLSVRLVPETSSQPTPLHATA